MAPRAIVGAVLAIVLGALRVVAADPLADGLATDDPIALDAAVHAIEAAPATPDLAPALFAAARACEDRLHQPARALALDERILRELPDAGVATAAHRRADALRAELGARASDARIDADASALSALIATADALPIADVEQRADALAAAAWPGAPDAALWLAEWTRRSGRFADAGARYAAVTARWPTTPQAIAAIRGGAGCALDAHDWAAADTLADRLPVAEPADRDVRDELRAAIARGRWRERLYTGAWIAIAIAIAALVGSLVHAARRAGRRWPSPRPPLEVVLIAPAVAVLVGVSFTAHPAIAPAVTTISIGGLVLAWLSGAALELARASGQRVRTRAIVQLAICIVGVVALAYIALMRDGLLDLLLETVRFGPEG